MRIIAGEWKGRKLFPPAGNRVRPTTDKVKEALFSMLMADVPGAVVVDLFSGTGNLGLEAMSRGALRVYFCDASRESFALTKRNIVHCGAQERSVCLFGDWEQALERIAEKVDLIFLDPPYEAGLMVHCMEKAGDLDLLTPQGILVCEHDAQEALPEAVRDFRKIKEKRYGAVGVTLYRREDSPE